MKISVLMPVFNREKYIKFAIDSIRNQSHSDFEFIIYDDGSSDDTVSIIKKYQSVDGRIKLIRGARNKGVGYARNQLLLACQTHYAIWQDSDDISDSNRIKLQLEKLDKPKLIFSDWMWLKFHRSQWKQREVGNADRAFASLLFPVNKTIMFDVNKIAGGEDWGWINRMQEIYESVVVTKPLYFVRFHDDRIGSWKRKLRKDLGGVFSAEELKGLSYAEAIEKYKKQKGK